MVLHHNAAQPRRSQVLLYRADAALRNTAIWTRLIGDYISRQQLAAGLILIASSNTLNEASGEECGWKSESDQVSKATAAAAKKCFILRNELQEAVSPRCAAHCTASARQRTYLFNCSNTQTCRKKTSTPPPPKK